VCKISAKSNHAFVSYGDFFHLCEKKKKKEKHESLLIHISETVCDFFQIWYVAFLVGRHLNCNSGIHQIKIMELRMHENRDFVVPVNILTYM